MVITFIVHMMNKGLIGLELSVAMTTHHNNPGNVRREGVLGNDFTRFYVANVHLSIGPTSDQVKHTITRIVIGSNAQSCVL